MTDLTPATTDGHIKEALRLHLFAATSVEDVRRFAATSVEDVRRFAATPVEDVRRFARYYPTVVSTANSLASKIDEPPTALRYQGCTITKTGHSVTIDCGDANDANEMFDWIIGQASMGASE